MSKFAASLAVATVLLSASAIAETAKPTVVWFMVPLPTLLAGMALPKSCKRTGITSSLRRIRYAVFRLMRLTSLPW